MTPPRPVWQLPAAETPAEVTRLACRLHVSPLIARLLWQRGLTSAATMDVFLSPGLRHLPQPGDFPGLTQAAETLAQGLAAGLPLAVWGDYDVDGVTSTALVLDFLARHGIAAGYHIPRRNAGYGLNIPGIEQLAEQGVRLLLTVDCGIAAVEAVARAKELGMTVVVSDHHLPAETLPGADALCNPRLGPCPCPALAGVGVAFLLMAALNRLLPGEPVDMRQFLDLVALGTLADMVDLGGVNRILVKNGLLKLKEAARPGIMALKEVAGIEPGADLGTGRVLFGLAPRINAAGRLDSAETALRLLLAKDRDEARPLAARLEELNEARKREEEAISTEALEQAATFADRQGLVLYAPQWHQGVIGIVASRVVENFQKPALVLCADHGKLKGSGRGVPGFDLHGALSRCAPLLLGFGGHRQAAGLSLAPERLPELRQAFHEAVLAQMGTAPYVPELHLDAHLPLASITPQLLRELELLQPFGLGNPEPVFTSGPVRVKNRRTFGNGHVGLTVHDPAGLATLAAKAWRQADSLPAKVVGQDLELAFSPKLSTYGGTVSIELHVKDWRTGPA